MTEEPVVVEVDDPRDPRLADFTGLTDVALRQRREPAEGLFVAEGELVVARALAAGYAPRALLCERRYVPRVAALLRAAPPDRPPGGPPPARPAPPPARPAPPPARPAPPPARPPSLFAGTPALLQGVTGFHVHRGVLASFARRPLPAPGELFAAGHRLLAVEDSNNPTNLGAIFRSAAALGMDGLLLSPRSADPLYRRCVRVSMGAVFTLPYARCPDWPAGLVAPGFRVLALTPDRAAQPLPAVADRLGAHERVVLLVGAEGPGLSPSARDVADAQVRIPMTAGVDSLNVAAAAAIACYALARRAGDSR